MPMVHEKERLFLCSSTSHSSSGKSGNMGYIRIQSPGCRLAKHHKDTCIGICHRLTLQVIWEDCRYLFFPVGLCGFLLSVVFLTLHISFSLSQEKAGYQSRSLLYPAIPMCTRKHVYYPTKADKGNIQPSPCVHVTISSIHLHFKSYEVLSFRYQRS